MSVDITALFSDDAQLADDGTRKRILDAALDETAAQGLHGLTIEGVARRCRMNRATIYRQFGGREALQSALLLREAQKLVQAMTKAVVTLQTPADVLAEGFVTAMRFAREHPVIQRLVAYEPGAVLEAAKAENSALLRLGGTVMSQTVLWAQSQGFANHLDAAVAGDVLARLFASFVLLPGGDQALTNDNEVRRFAQQTLVPMLQGAGNAQKPQP